MVKDDFFSSDLICGTSFAAGGSIDILVSKPQPSNPIPGHLVACPREASATVSTVNPSGRCLFHKADV